MEYRAVKVDLETKGKKTREESPWIRSYHELKSWFKSMDTDRDGHPSYFKQCEADGICFIAEQKDIAGKVERFSILKD